MSTQPSLRHIAAYLREKAAELPETPGHPLDRITIGIPGTTCRISCQASEPAVRAVAARYATGLPHGLTFKRPGRRATHRRCDLSTLMAFTEDGEWLNACEYLLLFPRSEWPDHPLVRRVMGEEAEL